MSESKTAENLLAPVKQTERIVSIDVVRGFALLGILVMNIQSFGLIGPKYMNPTAQGELSTASYWCWWFAHVFFDSKCMTIFSMLFGAGIALMVDRAKAQGRKSGWLHYRRMFWLLLIGLAHAHLLWYGDILVSYAMCGMILYWVSGWRPRFLIPSGLLLLVIGSAIMIGCGLSMPYWPEESKAGLLQGWAPTAEQIQQDLERHRGSWLDLQPHRMASSLMVETFLFALLFFWRIGGLMLLGMGLFKLGMFSGRFSTKFYRAGLFWGLAAGLSLVLTGVYFHEANDWQAEYSFFLGTQFNYWGSVLVSLAYVCLLVLFSQSQFLSWLQRSLAAVGQMALTNYLTQTIICTTIFYGHGLGWFGYLNRVQMLMIVVLIWALQLVLSPIWLKSFRFGPFEWLWRSLSYWRIQPIKRV